MSPKLKKNSSMKLYGKNLPAYTGERLKMISFPLGGIGTGCIGLGGRGELREWEIFNGPNHDFRLPYTMPYIFCKQGRNKVAKVLERRILPPFHGTDGLWTGYLAGLPRLKEAIFVGTYPVARIFFQDEDLPVSVQLEAFNPMIPGNAEDSGIPAAILVYRLTNHTKARVSGSIAISMANGIGLCRRYEAVSAEGLGRNINTFRDSGKFRGLYMTTAKYPSDHFAYGTEALVTTASRVSYATHFDEVGWWDAAQKIWDDYSDDGRLDGPRTKYGPSEDGSTIYGMLSAEYDLKAGASSEIVFIITWSFPQHLATWQLPKSFKPLPVRNHYARKFPDAWKAARYVVNNFNRLRTETLQFEQALFSSSLPGCVLDAVSSQMSTIRTNTTLWLDSPKSEKSGRIFGFEGCGVNEGTCPMNTTHVWNYEQSLAHLYPSLERTMRLTEYEDMLHPNGAMSFRTTLPLGEGVPSFLKKLPAADGQCGTVIRAYRDWRISGDTNWLRRIWPGVKKSIRFAWKGFAKWDADKDGLLEGIQHNTYDIDFHGPNTMCGTLYLGALLAASEMAQALCENKTSEEFYTLFCSGREKYDQLLFNGEYYRQEVRELKKSCINISGGSTIQPGHPKYQFGYGCLSDQLLGQWAAHVAGLGYLLPKSHVKKAIEAVYKHNFKVDLSRHASIQRTYALNDEKGLLLCTWPQGKREKFPFPYSDEIWTGVEYQVAAHLIYEGFMKEGLRMVAAVRERHDGVRRNPWSEFECGDHYARAMSSWSLLLALSGQSYDGRQKRLTIKPELKSRDFKCIYTANDAYGIFEQKLKNGRLAISVCCLGGKVPLASLALSWPVVKASTKESNRRQVVAAVNGKTIVASITVENKQIEVMMEKLVKLSTGDSLTLTISSNKRRK